MIFREQTMEAIPVKKTVSTPCALMLLFGMWSWMGVAEGWSESLVVLLWLAAALCAGITFGGLVYSFKKEVIDGEGSEQQ